MEYIDWQQLEKTKRRVTPRERENSEIWQINDIIPQRGPLIDMHGPGTVFYRLLYMYFSYMATQL